MDCLLRNTDCEAVSKNVFIIKKYNDGLYRLCYLKSKRNRGYEPIKSKMEKIKINVSDSSMNNIPVSISYEKIRESLSRSQRIIRELALCNDWQYFFTGTIDGAKLNRYDLREFSRKFRKFINNYNYRNPEHAVSYILVPEQHKNGAWHIHGLLKGISPEDFVFNKNSYLTWKQYDETFGYMSFEKIRDKERVASYIAKYISKSLGTCIAKGYRCFYSSQGLKRAENIAEFANVDDALVNSLDWDFEQKEGYCKLKTYKDLKEINDLALFLDGQPLVIIGGALSEKEKHELINEGFTPFPEEDKSDTCKCS